MEIGASKREREKRGMEICKSFDIFFLSPVPAFNGISANNDEGGSLPIFTRCYKKSAPCTSHIENHFEFKPRFIISELDIQKNAPRQRDISGGKLYFVSTYGTSAGYSLLRRPVILTNKTTPFLRL
jgi:hypothetical protein